MSEEQLLDPTVTDEEYAMTFIRNPMGFGKRNAAVLIHVYGRPVEIQSIVMKGIHAVVTVKRADTKSPFDTFDIKIVAKDELDAARQVLAASNKERTDD